MADIGAGKEETSLARRLDMTAIPIPISTIATSRASYWTGERCELTLRNVRSGDANALYHPGEPPMYDYAVAFELTGRAGEMHWFGGRPLEVLFRVEHFTPTDDAPDGRGTRIHYFGIQGRRILYASKSDCPIPLVQTGIYTADAGREYCDTCYPALALYFKVEFLRDCTWHAEVFGRRLDPPPRTDAIQFSSAIERRCLCDEFLSVSATAQNDCMRRRIDPKCPPGEACVRFRRDWDRGCGKVTQW